MNTLPEIFRQTHHNMICKRQGPHYLLQLGHSSHINSFMTTHRSFSKNAEDQKPIFRNTRYNNSTDKDKIKSKKNVFSTVSYDFLNDTSFYKTKQKRQSIESYKLAMHEYQKGIQILGLKIASHRGFKQQFHKDLQHIEVIALDEIKHIESQFKDQTLKLKQLLSQLRHQTRSQLKYMKQQLKLLNQDLILYCDQINKMDVKINQCKGNVQKVFQ